MLLCVRVGGGKTLISIFYIKNLFKRKMIDKVVFACTVSAAVAGRGEFEEKFGIDLPQYEKVEDFLNWLRGPEKVCVIKHSMFEKLGYDQAVINEIREICEQPNKRCAIVIDEVHKLGNPQSIAHTAFMNIKFMFERILVMTATPFNSGLLTTYGIISLVNPTLWKNVTAFKKMFITEQTILVNGKVARKEIVEYKNLNVYIEAKGIENDVFYIKKKLFIKYLDDLFIKTGEYSIYFEVYTKKQLLQAIEIIKDYAERCNSTVNQTS